jgi:hypothetical protein
LRPWELGFGPGFALRMPDSGPTPAGTVPALMPKCFDGRSRTPLRAASVRLWSQCAGPDALCRLFKPAQAGFRRLHSAILHSTFCLLHSLTGGFRVARGWLSVGLLHRYYLVTTSLLPRYYVVMYGQRVAPGCLSLRYQDAFGWLWVALPCRLMSEFAAQVKPNPQTPSQS